MNHNMSVALDRHITGNFGEDSIVEAEPRTAKRAKKFTSTSQVCEYLKLAKNYENYFAAKIYLRDTEKLNARIAELEARIAELEANQ